MNETDLRDCFAMFAMMGIVVRGGLHPELMPEEGIARRAYDVADAMLDVRKKEKDDGEELGIAAVRAKRKYPKRSSDL
jgi:hypothetical protein